MGTNNRTVIGKTSLYLVPYRFPVKENFLFQKLKKTWREELEVLDIWLLGGPRSLGNGVKQTNVMPQPG